MASEALRFGNLRSVGVTASEAKQSIAIQAENWIASLRSQ
jgi:hypothetical protein